MAIENRQAEGVVIHSGHGTQNTSWAFTRRALNSGLVPSMGSIGDCYDNGQMESLWARMRVEFLNRKRWQTRLEKSTPISAHSSASTAAESSSHLTRTVRTLNAPCIERPR